MRRLIVTLVAIAGMLLAGPAPAHADDNGKNYIYNPSYTGIGVMHLWDFDYTEDLYDVVLPSSSYTDQEFDWSYVEGYYIGSGYCAHRERKFKQYDAWGYGGEDVRGPIQVRVSRSYYWKVLPYRC